MKNYIKFLIVLLVFIVFIGACLGLRKTYNIETYNYQLNTILATQTPKNLFIDSWRIIKNKYYDSTLNRQKWDYWRRHYENNIKTYDDAYIAINSIILSLNDPYSKFLTPAEFKEQQIDLDAKISGIGVHIMDISGKILIVSVIEASPAAISGLKAGDVILTVDNVDVSGKNIADIAKSIRGLPNSYVSLKILRNTKKFTKKIQRKEVKLLSIKTKILPENIGYIQINSFMSATLLKEFEEALQKTKNSKGLIIDLRNNPGGILENAVLVANAFINKGAVVSIHGRNGRGFPVMSNPQINTIKKPIVVIVNQGSASASEILCGALKDYKLAVIVGERTFGKGMVQKVFNLPNGTGMNLTVAKYLTPTGTDINKSGIMPDYVVIDDNNDSNDEQLKKAIEVLMKQS